MENQAKLWQKNVTVNTEVNHFTVGNDREMDLLMAEFDVLGSLAHTQMLSSIGLLTTDELKQIQDGLNVIYAAIKSGDFCIEEGVEDVHSQVELLLTKRIGEAGKKIHSGRSRNDQVLVDLKLFTRNEIQKVAAATKALFEQLQELSETHKDTLLPGYTHLQIAMPSSFGLWFGAYAESLVDDLELLLAAYKVTNKNPLGSGAGYGSSFPLNREMTTDLLGFDTMHYNVVYAQMSRGKTEKIVAMALSSIAATLSKLSMDVCLYMSQNFGFISFPDELTTGSSIMPHKKNPDVFEIIRAKCNVLQALPNELTLLTSNLPSGYHRDMQLTKQALFPALQTIHDCLTMTKFMLKQVKVKKDILNDPKYLHLFSVEAVNAEVLSGTPFREAYKKVGLQLESGNFEAPTALNHSHQGSIGNLCNGAIAKMMDEVYIAFHFDKANKALDKLRMQN